jgi:pimeloyl-ACP methyl ester carboxylesterase
MPRVLVVPGAAVRTYVEDAVEQLRGRGADVDLLDAPGSPGTSPDLATYGRRLGARLQDEPPEVEPVDLLVGLSVGAQAAAVAAATPGPGSHSRIRRLVLVSPTVDPAARTVPRLLSRWLRGGRVEPAGLLREQAPEWRRAGAGSLRELVRSACRVEIERLLPAVNAPVDVVHAERDRITSHSYAAALAAEAGGRFVVVPGATHSWPHGDGTRFADLLSATVAR